MPYHTYTRSNPPEHIRKGGKGQQQDFVDIDEVETLNTKQTLTDACVQSEQLSAGRDELFVKKSLHHYDVL